MQIRFSADDAGRWVIGLTVLCVVAVCGCEKPEPPPVAYVGPSLAGDTLGVGHTPSRATSHNLLTQSRSSGRFPAAVAVARLREPRSVLSADPQQQAVQDQWCVSTIRWEEAVTWNSLFNQVPAVRELIVVDAHTTVRPNATLAEIAQSVSRLEAGLCLIYGPSEAAPGCAGLWGVLLDVATGQKLAMIQAQAGPEDYSLPRVEANERDMRHRDPNHIAELKFQQQTRHCLLDLIAYDSPSTATQPSPWRSEHAASTHAHVAPGRSARR